MQTPWKTDNWYTSPWNFADEVKATYNFAKNIKFHDVSLRDGEQQARLMFTKDQKIALAEKMAETGIHRIEAGMPAVSKADADAIKEIIKRNLGPEIFVFARCMKEDVLQAVDCGAKHIVVEIPASEHILKYAYKWEVQRAIDLSIETTLCAKEHGLYTVFFPIDGSRAGMGWFLDLIEKVATEGHMDALACVDTFGGLNPSASAYLIRAIKARINKPVEVHFHDDFGMGAANTVLALAAGADVAHTTISGIGERAGNAPYEDVALALLTMYGIDTGLKYENMYPLSKMMREFCGISIRQNRGIVGDDIAKIESGIVSAWYKNAMKDAPLELSPYLYRLTGHPDVEIVLGKHSGVPNIEMYLEKAGITNKSDAEKRTLTFAVKDKAMSLGRPLTEAEFVEMASK